jgi:hypothetical protein
MPFAKISPDTIRPTIEDEQDRHPLRDCAVAIDPPPSGAIGIEELLGRFEQFAESASLTDHPEVGPVGVKELLSRLNNLADAGKLSSPKDPDRDDK